MRNIIKAISVVLFFAVLYASAQYKNDLTKETRASSSFQYLNVKGEFTVHIVSAKSPAISIAGALSQIENTISYVSNDTLYIFAANSGKMDKKTDVVIYADQLKSVDAAGNLNIDLTNLNCLN